MSEKHLSELGWKTITVKNKVKDATLPKAFAKLLGLKEEDYAGRLKALKEIETAATELKKEHKAVKELVAYLDEIDKEVKKTRKEVEEAAKSAGKETQEKEGKEEEGEEAEKGKDGGKAKNEGKKDKEEEGSEADAEEEKEAKAKAKQAAALKALLLGSLGKIKSAQGAASFPFLACVGKPSYGLILGSSASDKPGPKHRALLSKLTKGTKFISGVCLFEEKAHTFVVATVPGGLAAHLKKAITTFTGGSYAVRVRDAEGKVVLDGETDVIPPEEEAEGTEGESEGEGEDKGTDLEAQWKKLRAELYPKIKEVLETNPPTRNEIIKLAGAASKQEKAKDFQGAINAFEELRPLLAGGKKAPPPPPPPPTPAALSYAQRLKGMMPDLTKALKEQRGDTGKMRAVAAFAQEKAAAGDHEAALKALDALKKLLADGGVGSGAGEDAKGEKEGEKSAKEEMAEFTQRVAALIPKVKANPKIKYAPGTSDEKGLNVLVSEAAVFAKKGDFEKAHELLDEVGAALVNGGMKEEGDEAESETEEEGDKTAKVTAEKENEQDEDEDEEIVPGAPASPVWQTAKEKVDAQLNGLYGVLKKVGLPVLDQAASQIEKVLSNYRTKLVAALMDYDKATGEAKEKAREKALKLVGSYQSEIPKDAHVIAADENPFGVKLNVRATLGAALKRLHKQLSAV